MTTPMRLAAMLAALAAFASPAHAQPKESLDLAHGPISPRR